MLKIKYFIFALLLLCGNLQAAETILDKTELTAPAAGDMLYIVHDPSGTPVDRKIQLQNLFAGSANKIVPAGSSTGNPVTLTATGSDSVVGLNIRLKGDADIIIGDPISDIITTTFGPNTGTIYITGDETTGVFASLAMVQSNNLSNTAGSTLSFSRSRGTLAVPTPALESDFLGAVYAYGQGTTFAHLAAGIEFSASADLTDTNWPSNITFVTSPPTGTPFAVTRLTIDENGLINISGLTASNLVATDASKNLISLPLNTYLTSAGAVTSIKKTGSAALVGDVTLTGGSNVTLTQVGQDISIAATAGGSGTVTSVGLVGTANQVTVTGTSPITSSGSWTLSLPQDIATSSTPQFARLGLGAAAHASTLLTLTQGSANTALIGSTGYSLTGSDATNAIDIAGTWNTSGNPTALKINITNTASGGTASFADFQASGVTKFRVRKSGVIDTPTLLFDADGTIYNGAKFASVTNFQGTPALTLGTGSDLAISRNAAGIAEINSGSACSTAANCRDLKLRHVIASGAAPSLDTGCGTGTLATGASDGAGKITTNTTGACTIVLTFGVAYARAPACAVNNETTANLARATTTTTTATFGGTTISGDVWAYTCTGY